MKHSITLKSDKLRKYVVIGGMVTTLLFAAKLVLAQCSPGCGNVPASSDFTTVDVLLCPFGCSRTVYANPIGDCVAAESTDSCCEWSGDLMSTFYPGTCESGAVCHCDPATGQPHVAHNMDFVTTGTCAS